MSQAWTESADSRSQQWSFYHLFGAVLPGGYLGVDIFFVLSGFLITSLLIREKTATGRIDLKYFWLKRFRRIVPAAVFVLSICTIAAAIVRGDATVDLARQFLTTLFFVNNWGQIAASQSYFADTEVFAHYWSLSIEEQFYIVWPVIVMALLALWGVYRLRWIALVCFALAGLSLWWMIQLYVPGDDPSRVYYGTDTHAFGLLIGAGMAIWMQGHRHREMVWQQRIRLRGLTGTLEVVALVGVLLLMATLSDGAPETYNGGLFLASVLTAVVMHGVIKGNRVLAPLFSLWILRHLGRLSFSLYLWHWPVIVFCREIMGDTQAAAWVALVVSWILSEISVRLVEDPFRRRGYASVVGLIVEKNSSPLRMLSTSAVAIGAVLATIGGLVYAPQMTEMEYELAAREEQQKRAQEEALVQAKKATATQHSEAPASAQPTVPEGTDILAIGDSVMLAASSAMYERLPGIYVDGAVSRHYESVPGLIATYEAQGMLRDNIVLGFGTNGPSNGAGDEQLLDTIIQTLDEDRTIVIVLPYGDRWYMPEAEAEVLDRATKYPNVYVANWCHAAKNDPLLLRDDYIHPTVEGTYVYTDAVMEALKQASTKDPKDKVVPGVCGV
ncbi:acyltransferase family protein [Corynebacterium sp.]|uniref:acyltransferase family protein n=1 Tax=Corynebacterium sp. TaxID=1720 RepID=UPI003735FA9A